MSTNDLTEKRLVDSFYRRLIEHYGYVVNQMARDVSLGNGLHADIAIWKTAELKAKNLIPDICVVVICKSEHIKIDASEYLDSYKTASFKSFNFFVLHNLKETKVFHLDGNRPKGGFIQIGDFPKANDMLSDASVKDFIQRMNTVRRDGLFKAFDRCHNIVRNNDKLSPEAAFDEISKVMFIKRLYEGAPDGELIYSQAKFIADEKKFLSKHRKGNYIKHLFDEVKHDLVQDSLFERHDNIRLCRNSFLSILKELEVVDFYDMDEDVKGVAFEHLVGKTFRGELGQFFTPRQIVDFIIRVLDIKEGEKVCDPCCGSGGFLIRAFEYVQQKIDQDVQRGIDAVKASSIGQEMKHRKIKELLDQCNKNIPNSRYAKLCKDYFFGVDANFRMARTAKMNMIMHGDGHVGVYLHDGLLDCYEVQEGRFDVVLINPPYGVHVDRKARDGAGNLIFGGYKTSQSIGELLFVERVIKLLKPGGRAGIVLPEGIFTNINLRSFRDFVESKARILCITAMPPNVFLASGANVKPNLLFIEKYIDAECSDAERLSKVCLVNADTEELGGMATRVHQCIYDGLEESSRNIRVVDRESMVDWAAAPFFTAQDVVFSSKYKMVRLAEILRLSEHKIRIQDNVQYRRVTVRLAGMGAKLRDVVMGADIGTKTQTVVHAGQLVVSKIDGKSGAMAIVPTELDGAIVTSDFPVFDIDENRVLADFLELVLCHENMLKQMSATASGSTGRRRLSVQRFLSMQIALPPLAEQNRLIARICQLRMKQMVLQKELDSSIQAFYAHIMED